MEKDYGCAHYKRKCEILAPCCGIWYPCRHCHNEKYRGPKSSGCKTEQLPRTEVKKIRCLVCEEEQSLSTNCIKCGVLFARYYCEKCCFYDDAENKNIFHCDDCRMCRIGKKEENEHCYNCGICINKSLKEDHKCIEIQGQNCPICMEPLLESIKPYIQLERCYHWIHLKCLDDYERQNRSNRCPVCGTSLFKMSKIEIEAYDKMVEETKANMPEEFKQKKADIICMDCLEKSEGVDYHILAIKCASCGSYNTRL